MKDQICSRCIMDTVGDPTIKFESDGTCNYCNDALKAMDKVYFPNEEGKRRLEELMTGIKEYGKGKSYDCMMGLSGGLDSSYVAYLGYKYELKILAVHIDDGMDADITTENIRKICDTFKIDLIVEKPEKSQFADLTRSFILAGVPDIAIPQDNVLFATLFKFAKKNKIRYFLSGANFSLENITQMGYDALDTVHIRDIHKKFGRIPLDKKLPLFSVVDKRIKYKYLFKIQMPRPLYFVDYNAKQALAELKEICGYEYYGNKHWESRFTKFLQVYYLPEKFNIDKRKSHYSSLIVSGQMTREEAVLKIAEPLCEKTEIEKEIEFVLDKIGMARSEFEKIMKEHPRQHSEYRSSFINKIAAKVLSIRRKRLGY